MTKNWAENKEHILRYYQQEGQSLTKVMMIMKSEHSFHASQRAYRQQFRKWSIFKYNRKSRMLPLAHSCPARCDPCHNPRVHYTYPQNSPYSNHRMSLPLPKLERNAQYPLPQSMSYQSTTLARIAMPQTPPSPDSTVYTTDHYDSYKTMDAKSAYHDSSIHHSIADRSYSEGSASPYRAHYQHSLQGQGMQYAQSAYHTPVSPSEPSTGELSSDSVSRYTPYVASCCSHGQGPVSHSPYHGSVPMVRSGSQTSLSSHSSHNSGSSPGTQGPHGHSPYGSGSAPGQFGLHTATLPSQSHTQMYASH